MALPTVHMVGASLMCRPKARLLIAFKGHETVGEINRLQGMILDLKTMQTDHVRGDGAGPAGTASAGPMLEAKLMNLIKGWLQKF